MTTATLDCEILIEEIQQYSRMMLIEANEANWEKVSNLETQCERMIRSMFNTAIPEGNALAIAARCEEVQRVQLQLVELAAAARNAAAEELIRLRNASKVKQSYSDFRFV